MTYVKVSINCRGTPMLMAIKELVAQDLGSSTSNSLPLGRILPLGNQEQSEKQLCRLDY